MVCSFTIDRLFLHEKAWYVLLITNMETFLNKYQFLLYFGFESKVLYVAHIPIIMKCVSMVWTVKSNESLHVVTYWHHYFSLEGKDQMIISLLCLTFWIIFLIPSPTVGVLFTTFTAAVSVFKSVTLVSLKSLVTGSDPQEANRSYPGLCMIDNFNSHIYLPLDLSKGKIPRFEFSRVQSDRHPIGQKM